jgi:hypothetical protein
MDFQPARAPTTQVDNSTRHNYGYSRWQKQHAPNRPAQTRGDRLLWLWRQPRYPGDFDVVETR